MLHSHPFLNLYPQPCMRHFILTAVLFVSVFSYAQPGAKVIMHLQSADTLVHKSIVNQIGNIKKELPDAQIEVVCHGPGLEFLRKDKAFYVNKIQKMNLKDVSFVGCEYTMQQRNYKKEDLVPYALTVPYGLVEIIKKQQADWIYVKLGF
jgi:uncharacterized protein